MCDSQVPYNSVIVNFCSPHAGKKSTFTSVVSHALCIVTVCQLEPHAAYGELNAHVNSCGAERSVGCLASYLKNALHSNAVSIPLSHHPDPVLSDHCFDLSHPLQSSPRTDLPVQLSTWAFVIGIILAPVSVRGTEPFSDCPNRHHFMITRERGTHWEATVLSKLRPILELSSEAIQRNTVARRSSASDSTKWCYFQFISGK